MLKGPRLAAVTLIGFLSIALVPSAHAWGCKGHQAVALIAEAHLTPHAREMALNVLNAVPIDPTLPRYCGASGLDLFADASTWPDDIRKLRPDTPPWHFIDIPRGAPKSDLAKYCSQQEGLPGPRQGEPGRSGGCVTSALVEQVRVLRDPNSSAQAKADALRFVIHFVGDIHQPLHAITNNDMGGNCVPVAYFGIAPVENNPGSGSFHPNLHSIWDTDIVEHLSPSETSSQLASALDKKFDAKISDWMKQPADFEAWAWESHELAEKVAYGRLPHPLPIETPRPMSGCVDPTDPTSHDRLLKIDENLSDEYQDAAAPVVEEQLAKAGARLAALLNSTLY